MSISDYAVDYCENHDCIDCFIYKNGIEFRTEQEHADHEPCCVNIERYCNDYGVSTLPEGLSHNEVIRLVEKLLDGANIPSDEVLVDYTDDDGEEHRNVFLTDVTLYQLMHEQLIVKYNPNIKGILLKLGILEA